MAHVAYLSSEEVVGLSKLAQYVRWQSRQLTIQEHFTNDIVSDLAEELDSPMVLVEMSATHLCGAMHGIETESTTTTSTTVGELTGVEREQFQAAVARVEGQQ